jgi:hypothetical protein
MQKYQVTIQAMIAQTYEVEGINAEDAKEQAFHLWNNEPNPYGTYGDEIIDCRLIEPEPETYIVSSIQELRDVLGDLRDKILQNDVRVHVDNTGKITIEPAKG